MTAVKTALQIYVNTTKRTNT